MKLIFCLCLCFALANVFAAATASEQQSVTSPQPATGTPPANLPPHPQIDPSRQLKGADLVGALRAGGLVLYLRHTDTGRVTRDCLETNLSPLGEEQEKRLGVALRNLKIPFGQIESSEVCRVQDTARLIGAGAFQTNEDLNNMPKRPGHDVHAARMRRLALPPARGTNTLLVAHVHDAQPLHQRLSLEIGEVIVFRPDGKGGSEAVARIRLTDWLELEGYR